MPSRLHLPELKRQRNSSGPRLRLAGLSREKALQSVDRPSYGYRRAGQPGVLRQERACFFPGLGLRVTHSREHVGLRDRKQFR
jgi:hypothetical protein